MALRQYLAMTATEMEHTQPLPPAVAYMACHFSPYGLGLAGCPTQLPPDSLLILNDRMPIHRHDPAQVARELAELTRRLGCCGVLLDFQRPGSEEVVGAAVDTLECPVCVTEGYAHGLSCPVLLNPVPVDVCPEDWFARFPDRQLWLEVGLEAKTVTVTASGAGEADADAAGDFPHFDSRLCCHYRIDATEQAAVFTLKRTAEDLSKLLSRAEEYGVLLSIGLFQELGGL